MVREKNEELRFVKTVWPSHSLINTV